jgi:uncharacterized membrane protein YfcA
MTQFILSISKMFTIVLISQICVGAEFHVSCQTSEECSQSINSSYQCVEGVCKNEKLTNLSKTSVFGIVLIIVVSSIANAGGIGGGAILSAVYILLFGFSIGDSIPLSNATIFSGALVNIFIIINKRQSANPNKLVIDFKMCSLILPLMLGGALVGVILNKVIPPIFILCMLAAYLVNRTYAFYFETVKISDEEKRKKASDSQAQKGSNIGTEKPIELTSNVQSPNAIPEIKPDRNDVEGKTEFLICDKGRSLVGFYDLITSFKTYLLFCLLSYCILLSTMLLRGGKAFTSIIGIDSCSFASWFILILSQVSLLFIALWSFRTQQRDPFGDSSPSLQNEDKTDSSGNSYIITTMQDSFKTGVISGTLGLGGGMILMPILIQKKFSPEIASAICGFLVLLTSFSTTSQFLIMGAFDIKSTLVVIVSSGIGSFVGTQLINYAITKYQKPSLIMWVVFIVLLTSAIVLPYVGIMNLISNPKILNFSSPC